MAEKEFVRADDLVRDSFRLAKRIYDSGYHPDVLLVLWRGGTPVGVVVHEFFCFKGLKTYHTAVKAESYIGIGKRRKPTVENLSRVMRRIDPDTRVLVIDDIFDTGCTLKLVRDRLLRKTPHVRTATLYFKIDANQTDLTPDFYLRKTERWIVFPHELMDLTDEELARKDAFVAGLLGLGG